MKQQILTHDDLDGIASAVLLSLALKIKDIKIQDVDNSININKNTIISDLPYHKNCYMWFDHHISNKTNKKFKGKFELEKSCARVIYNYFNKRFPKYYKELVKKVDKADSGDYTIKDIKAYNPIYLIDRITFLSIFNNKKDKILFFKKLRNHLLNQRKFNDLLKDKQIKRLIKNVKDTDRISLSFIKKQGFIKDNTLIIDSSNYQGIFNPFFIYTKYPKCKYVLIITRRERRKRNKLGFLLIFNKFYKTNKILNLGKICKKYGGNGHKTIGGFRIKLEDKEKVIKNILKQLK